LLEQLRRTNFPEKLIPLMITNAMEEQAVARVWRWVERARLDSRPGPLRRRACGAGAGQAGEVYNLGGESEWRNIDLVKALLDVMGKPHSLIEFVKDRPDTTAATRSIAASRRSNFAGGRRWSSSAG